MIPKYKYMPEASKVIKIEYFLKKKQVSKILKQKPLDSERLNLCIKNDLLEEYFTSKELLRYWKKRTKNFISNSKIISSNSVKLTKLIKSSKKLNVCKKKYFNYRVQQGYWKIFSGKIFTTGS